MSSVTSLTQNSTAAEARVCGARATECAVRTFTTLDRVAEHAQRALQPAVDRPRSLAHAQSRAVDAEWAGSRQAAIDHAKSAHAAGPVCEPVSEPLTNVSEVLTWLMLALRTHTAASRAEPVH